MRLAEVFTALACKVLVPVDLPEKGSNQHEINGVQPLRTFFGSSGRTDCIVNWHRFRDDRDTEHGQGRLTFYDARLRSAAKTSRSEWRLYYTGGFLASSRAGDILLLARDHRGRVHGMVFEASSAWWRAVGRAMETSEVGPRVRLVGNKTLRRDQLLLSSLLVELDLDVSVDESVARTAQVELDRATASGRNFPSTQRMASLARLGHDASPVDADSALLDWLEREERLFLAIENRVVGRKLATGFKSVEDFSAFALSVLNRRKSRMGYSLQHHLSEIFRRAGLRYDEQEATEGRNRPDFLFPGAQEYRDTSFPSERLLMLAAKASCKDRWRQVLTEAARLPLKHLCTLEQAISVHQTDEMARQGVVLVVPGPLHDSYAPTQRERMLTVEAFVRRATAAAE